MHESNLALSDHLFYISDLLSEINAEGVLTRSKSGLLPEEILGIFLTRVSIGEKCIVVNIGHNQITPIEQLLIIVLTFYCYTRLCVANRRRLLWSC